MTSEFAPRTMLGPMNTKIDPFMQVHASTNPDSFMAVIFPCARIYANIATEVIYVTVGGQSAVAPTGERMSAYEILAEYLLTQQSAIDRGEPVVVEVRDTDTFERLVVRAQIVPPGRDLAGSNELVLRNLAENVAARGWRILVLDELDGESVQSVPVSAFRKDAGPNA